jgi:hypothetical protein
MAAEREGCDPPFPRVVNWVDAQEPLTTRRTDPTFDVYGDAIRGGRSSTKAPAQTVLLALAPDLVRAYRIATRASPVRRPTVLIRSMPQRSAFAPRRPNRPPVSEKRARWITQKERMNQRGGSRGCRLGSGSSTSSWPSGGGSTSATSMALLEPSSSGTIAVLISLPRTGTPRRAVSCRNRPRGARRSGWSGRR